jgi:hypothetical protein
MPCPDPRATSGRPRRLPRRRVAAGLLFLVVGGPVPARSGAAPASTQPGEALDAGSFSVSVAGQRAGREQFSVRRGADNDEAVLEYRSEVAIGDRRAAVRLGTDAAGAPVRYALDVRIAGEPPVRVGGQRVRNRFAIVSRTPRGEAAREFLLEPGLIVLDDEALHQHAQLVLGRALAPGDTARLPVLLPMRNRQGVVRLALEADADTVVLGGVRLPARRWRATLDDEPPRHLWADARGRLLRLRIPARALEAVRDDIPR